MFHNVWELEKKVTNSKSYLQGHSKVLAMLPFDRPHMISY